MSAWRKILRSILAVTLGLALGLSVTRFAGENPFHVFKILVKGAFGTPYDFGMTLFYTTPLLFTGLSVMFAFRAGLFNIGAEGQMTLGTLSMAAVGILCPGLHGIWAPLVAIAGGFLGGAAWGFVPGWLKAKRGSHEVITTIMLNFVAAGLASYATLYLLRTTDSQAAESKSVAPAFLLHPFAVFQGAPVSAAFLLAIALVLVLWFFLSKTVLGYELRASGQNETASEFAGIEAKKMQILAMTISGGLAGLVGAAEVLGNSGRFKMDFSPGYGFMGIAVALLGRGHPLGVAASALLFGALHKGASDLDMETQTVTRDISQILQGLVILTVSADGLWDWMQKRRKKK